MSYATIRDGIETALNTIPKRGTVHDYWRHTPTRGDFISTYQTTIDSVTQVRAWIIQWAGITPAEASAFGEQGLNYHFDVYLLRTLNDAAESEKEFGSLLETGMRVLMQKRSYGAAGARIASTAITGVTIEHAMFDTVLCHRGVISLTVTVDVAQTWS